jgi:hypothetical protein
LKFAYEEKLDAFELMRVHGMIVNCAFSPQVCSFLSTATQCLVTRGVTTEHTDLFGGCLVALLLYLTLDFDSRLCIHNG